MNCGGSGGRTGRTGAGGEDSTRGRSRGRGGRSSGRGGSGGGASPKPVAKGAASPKPVAKGTKSTKSRGLIIAAPHIDKFFAPIMERKTHEVRNFYCRIVAKGEHIYLVQSGLKDVNGKGMFCVRGKAEFRGNSFVQHEDFSKHYNKHRCSGAEYSSVRSSWADKGGCVLWELKLVEVFDEIWTLFDMSTASTDPLMIGPSVSVPQPEATVGINDTSSVSAASAPASSLVSVGSVGIGTAESTNRQSPAEIQRALDEHCPRKAARANTQRDSRYPCHPDNDLLYGDEDSDSLASALSDIIAEEYPLQVERATQPSASLAMDAAAALETHRVKTTTLREDDRAPAAEPVTTSTTTTTPPMSAAVNSVNSVNVQANDADVSEGGGVGGHDPAVVDADVTLLLSTQADGATLIATAPTLPHDEVAETLRVSTPAGPPPETRKDAEMPPEPADIDVDETIRVHSAVEMPSAATSTPSNTAETTVETLSMRSEQDGPGGDIPMPTPAAEVRREQHNAEMPTSPVAPTLSQQLDDDDTMRTHDNPGGDVPMPTPAVPAVPPPEVQNDVGVSAAAPTLPQHEPLDVDEMLRMRPMHPHHNTEIPRSSEPQSDDVDVDVGVNPPGSMPVTAATVPTPAETTSKMSEAVPEVMQSENKLHSSCPGCPMPARKKMPSTSASASDARTVTVTNLKEYFDFFQNAVDAVLADGTISPGLLRDGLDKLSISTAYSGIGGPEATLFTLRDCFARQGHGVRLQSTGPEIMFQMEIDPVCRRELLKYESLGGHSHGGHGCCLFGNLEEFFRPELEDVVAQLRERPELALEVLSKAVAECEDVSRRMARVHIAGTSCVSWSAQGKQLGVRDATVLPFLVWICHRLLLQEPVIIHENSPRFPRSLLERFLGHLYVIDDCIIESSEYGSPARRERKLTRLYHRVKTFQPDVPFSTFNRAFHRSCTMTWREFYWRHLLTSHAELHEDLAWASGRPTVRAGAVVEAEDSLDNEFEKALNPTETKSLRAYRAKSPTMAYSLSQNGATTFAMTSSAQHLQTMIRHSGLTWCDGPLATGAGTEVLVTQAWPVHPIVNAGMKVTPFHVDSPDPRMSRVLRAQAGNSMNLFMLTVQFLHTLCHVEVPEQFL
ncbi:unnamed protein product [Symbiodinium sp. CCMP2456]|nr:unnamed protein product [Symbiodinium sp. CCMP2456]